jgi:hypothetical protein
LGIEFEYTVDERLGSAALRTRSGSVRTRASSSIAMRFAARRAFAARGLAGARRTVS